MTALVGMDLEAFTRWADTALPGATPPFTAEVLAGGRSNITMRVRDGAGHDYVVRRPPLHHVLPTAHDMGREFRIIAALGPTAVPVPEALAYCADPEIIGAPFYVMSFVEGVLLPNTAAALAELDQAARARSGESLVDALVALHAVDVDAVGLGDLARREAYIARQLKRWHTQLNASSTREIAALDRVHALLAARMPPQTESTVVHGDFRLGNCILDQRGGVRAVLDWEICTLGDPRADLGYVLATWAQPNDPLRANDDDPTLAPGFVTRAALLARYAERSGRDVDTVPYFIAFSFWRLACILEGVVARMRAGARGDRDAEDEIRVFRRRVDDCVQLAEEYAASL